MTQADLARPLIGGSLFTGYGGLDLATAWLFHDHGIDLRFVWDSDIKPAARTLLAHRRPHAPNLGDLTAVFPVDRDDPSIVLPVTADVPRVDVLTFGWNCQPFSAAGKRLGEKDHRALWPNVRAAIIHLRPTYLFGENVARVASVGELRRVVQALAQVGYVGAWRCVRAGDVGAPHRRDRLFLCAVRIDGGGTDAAADALGLLLRDEPGRGGGAGGSGARVAGDDGSERAAGGLSLLPTPRASDGPNGGPNQRGRRGDYALPTIMNLLPTPGARLGGSGSVQPAAAAARAARRPNGPNLDDVAALLPTPAVADARNARNATAGRTPENDRHRSGWTLSDVAHADRWGKYADAITRWERLLGREAPAAALPTGRSEQMQLNAAFVEWMMGLPAGWVTDVPGLTRAQQLSMLGDGVVPQQARYAYGLLLDDLAATRTRELAS